MKKSPRNTVVSPLSRSDIPYYTRGRLLMCVSRNCAKSFRTPYQVSEMKNGSNVCFVKTCNFA